MKHSFQASGYHRSDDALTSPFQPLADGILLIFANNSIILIPLLTKFQRVCTFRGDKNLPTHTIFPPQRTQRMSKLLPGTPWPVLRRFRRFTFVAMREECNLSWTRAPIGALPLSAPSHMFSGRGSCCCLSPQPFESFDIPQSCERCSCKSILCHKL
jgi:hypothetical protein